MDIKLLVAILLSSVMILGILTYTWWAYKTSARAAKRFVPKKLPKEIKPIILISHTLGVLALIGLFFSFELFLILVGAHFIIKGIAIYKAKTVSDIFYTLFGKPAEHEGLFMAFFGAVLVIFGALGGLAS